MKREMVVECRIKGGSYWYVILSSNRKILATSEMYVSASNAKRAARRVANDLNLPYRVKTYHAPTEKGEV